MPGLSQLTWQMSNNIIDNLSHDTDTLASCSLVSKAWLLRSRRYMFQNISILNEKQLYQYLDLLPYSTFRLFVEELTIRPVQDETSNLVTRMKLKYTDLVRLFSKMPSLQLVFMSDLAILQGGREVVSVLTDPEWSPPHLYRAQIVNVTDENNALSNCKLASILRLFRAVDILLCQWIDVPGVKLNMAKIGETGQATAKFKALPRINGLVLPHTSAAFGFMRSLLQMNLCTSLTTLTVFITNDDMLAAFGKVLRSASRSLKAMQVYMYPCNHLMNIPAEEVAKHLDLSNCTSLTTLELSLVLQDVLVEDPTARARWQWATNLAMLYSLPPDTLQEFHLALSPHCIKPANTVLRLADVPWRQLHSAMRRFPKFAKLVVSCPESVGEGMAATLAVAITLAVCSAGDKVSLTWRVVYDDVWPQME